MMSASRYKTPLKDKSMCGASVVAVITVATHVRNQNRFRFIVPPCHRSALTYLCTRTHDSHTSDEFPVVTPQPDTLSLIESCLPAASLQTINQPHVTQPQQPNDGRAKRPKTNHSCLPTPPSPPAATFLYPSVVIEVLSEQYKQSSAVIKEQGPLHWARVPHILKCIEIENSVRGAYLAFQLGRRPHYQLDQSLKSRIDLREAAKGYRVPYKRLSRTTSHHVHDVVTAINHGTPQYSTIKPIMDTLPFRRFLNRGMQAMEQSLTPATQSPTESGRAPMTWSFGYSSQCYKVPDGGVTAVPGVLLGTDAVVTDAMATMTMLLSTMCSMADIPYPFTGNNDDNDERSKRFSRVLSNDDSSPDNNIEAMSVSITRFSPTSPSDNQTFGCHVDSSNDPEQDYTLCAYRFFWCSGVVYRVAILAYSRKSIGDFLKREARVESYIANLTKFITDRQCRYDHDPSVLPTDKSKFRSCLSSFDMCGHASVFIDAVLLLHDASGGLSWELVLELLLPVLYVESLDKLATLYRNMQSSSSLLIATDNEVTDDSSGHFTTNVLQRLVSKFKSVRFHKEAHSEFRHQDPATLQGRLYDVITVIDSIFRQTHGECPPTHAELYQSISKADPAHGEDGTQQFIFIAAILGVIPRNYALDAQFCKGTATAKAMNRSVGSSEKAVRNIFGLVSRDVGLPVSFIWKANRVFVNRYHKSGFVIPDSTSNSRLKRRSSIRYCLPRDTFLPGQRLFRLRQDADTGEAVVEWCNSDVSWMPFDGILFDVSLLRYDDDSDFESVSTIEDDYESITTTIEDAVCAIDASTNLSLVYPSVDKNSRESPSTSEYTSTRLSDVLPNYHDVIASSVENGHVYYFDLLLESLAVLSSNEDLRYRRPTRTDFKSIPRSYVHTTVRTPPHLTTRYTASIRTESIVCVVANETRTTWAGRLPHYTKADRTWYNKRACAERAVMTTTILQARKRRDTNGHPYWASRILSPSESSDSDFRVLVRDNDTEEYRIFGILVWKGGSHHLVLPDESNSFVDGVEHFELNVEGQTERIVCDE